MVGGKESAELWHLDDLDPAGLVNVEVAPGFFEEGIQILIESSTSESFMGAKNLLSGRGSVFLIHPKFADWLASGL